MALNMFLLGIVMSLVGLVYSVTVSLNLFGLVLAGLGAFISGWYTARALAIIRQKLGK